jgi:hypothetical protein
MTQWKDGITAVLNRYAPGGDGPDCANKSPSTCPKWAPITTWEVWNEPNSMGNAANAPTTGTAGTHCGSTAGLSKEDVARLIHDGWVAIQAHASDPSHQWQPLVVGIALGSMDLDKLDDYEGAFKTLYPGDNMYNYMDAISVHIYVKDDPTTTGGTGHNQDGVRTIDTLGAVRSHLDTQSPNRKIHIFITEGGYAGTDDPKSNTCNGGDDDRIIWASPTHLSCPGTPNPSGTSVDQGTWGLGFITELENHPEWLVDHFSPYSILDRGDHSWDPSALGAVKENGLVLKQWGSVYGAKIKEQTK